MNSKIDSKKIIEQDSYQDYLIQNLTTKH